MQETTFKKIVRRTGTSLCILLPKEEIKVLRIKEGDLVEVKLKKIEL